MPKEKPKVTEDESWMQQVLDFAKQVQTKDFQEKLMEQIRKQIPPSLPKDDRALEDFRDKVKNKVFNWENPSTSKPALDSFMKMAEGYDRLSKTFDAKQKKIVDETDYNENMAAMVGLMRKQIETSERDAKVQSKRFLASMIIAVASVVVAVFAIMA